MSNFEKKKKKKKKTEKGRKSFKIGGNQRASCLGQSIVEQVSNNNWQHFSILFAGTLCLPFFAKTEQ